MMDDPLRNVCKHGDVFQCSADIFIQQVTAVSIERWFIIFRDILKKRLTSFKYHVRRFCLLFVSFAIVWRVHVSVCCAYRNQSKFCVYFLKMLKPSLLKDLPACAILICTRSYNCVRTFRCAHRWWMIHVAYVIILKACWNFSYCWQGRDSVETL